MTLNSTARLRHANVEGDLETLGSHADVVNVVMMTDYERDI